MTYSGTFCLFADGGEAITGLMISMMIIAPTIVLLSRLISHSVIARALAVLLATIAALATLIIGGVLDVFGNLNNLSNFILKAMPAMAVASVLVILAIVLACSLVFNSPPTKHQ